jgi:hypothetical protein
LYRAGGHDPQSIDLLGDFHGPQFGGDSGPDPAGHHHARQNGCQFPAHGDGHNAAYGISRSEADEFLGRLDAHDHTGAQDGHADNGQRICPQPGHLAQDFPLVRSPGNPAGFQEQVHDAAHPGAQIHQVVPHPAAQVSESHSIAHPFLTSEKSLQTIIPYYCENFL